MGSLCLKNLQSVEGWKCSDRRLPQSQEALGVILSTAKKERKRKKGRGWEGEVLQIDGNDNCITLWM